MKPFESLIEESFSAASYMDVRELRALYYGRINLYASFSDDTDYDLEGRDDRRSTRPAGVLCHTVNSIVARKVSSSKFYASVFRINKSGGKFVEDLRGFSSEDYQAAKEVLYAISYIDDELVDEAVARVEANPRLRSTFEKFWELTKLLSGKGSDMPRRWARILIDLGYDGFADESGSGLLIKSKVPVAILLNMAKMEELDVVPIQKYRVDPRRRVQSDVDRKVKRLVTKRNRVAKKKTDAVRGRKEKGSALGSVIGKVISRFI